MKKITSVKSINNPNFKLKIGTFDKKCPETFFITGSTYIIPNFDSDFKQKISSLRKIINFKLMNELIKNDILEQDTISILDIPEDRMKQGKKSYLYFECHFKQKGDKNFKDLISECEPFIEKVSNIMEDNILSMGFEINKKR